MPPFCGGQPGAATCRRASLVRHDSIWHLPLGLQLLIMITSFILQASLHQCTKYKNDSDLSAEARRYFRER